MLIMGMSRVVIWALGVINLLTKSLRPSKYWGDFGCFDFLAPFGGLGLGNPKPATSNFPRLYEGTQWPKAMMRAATGQSAKQN